MFKSEIVLIKGNSEIEGFEQMFLEEEALRMMKFNDEEIEFLIKLNYFNKYELFPMRKNGIIINKNVRLDAFCTSLVDFYYGTKPIVENYYLFKSLNRIHGLDVEIINVNSNGFSTDDIKIFERQCFLAKSIVEKYSPWIYSAIF
jgi:hypothetical protein